MDRLPIEIKLRTEATPELVSELAPHVVIVASGHGDTPKFPKNVEGLDNEIVCTTMDLLNGKAPKNSLVLGGGFMGCDIAQHIASAGKKVKIVSKNSMENIGGTVGFFTRNSLFELLGKLEVEILPNLDYKKITDKGLIALDDNNKEIFIVIYYLISYIFEI